MACIPGSLPAQPHQVFQRFPIELERSSSYTLDFEIRPASGTSRSATPRSENSSLPASPSIPPALRAREELTEWMRNRQDSAPDCH